MPATIQKILKPTKYRAVDTSTSEQLGPEYYNDISLFLSGDQAESTSGTYWHTSANVIIDADGSSSKPCVIFGPDDPSSGNSIGGLITGYNEGTIKGQGASPFGDIQQGDKFQVTYTFDGDVPSGGTIRVQIFSVSSAGNGNHDRDLHVNYMGQGPARSGSTDGVTYTDDITVDTFKDGPAGSGASYNNAFLLIGGNDTEAGWDSGSVKIKNISIRKYYSQANSNHGQIYSGRALEFDGVSDYLDLGADTLFIDSSEQSTTAEKAWTVAAWINYDAAGSLRQNILGANNGISSGTIAISDSEKLYIYDQGASTGRVGNTALQPLTWYRAVWSYDGDGTLTFYLNGVADGTATLGTSGNDPDLAFR